MYIYICIYKLIQIYNMLYIYNIYYIHIYKLCIQIVIVSSWWLFSLLICSRFLYIFWLVLFGSLPCQISQLCYLSSVSVYLGIFHILIPCLWVYLLVSYVSWRQQELNLIFKSSQPVCKSSLMTLTFIVVRCLVILEAVLSFSVLSRNRLSSLLYLLLVLGGFCFTMLPLMCCLPKFTSLVSHSSCATVSYPPDWDYLVPLCIMFL